MHPSSSSLASSHASRAARARIGSVVDGRWRLDALVAVGGCSSIYAVSHAGNGHRAAMKIFDVELADNETAVAHFLAEGRAANRIGHPGVVAVVDQGTTQDGAPYLLMPLLEGETAQQRVSRVGALPPAEALHVVAEVLDVLMAAHARGIVHRDLKPDNVFLERGGGVRVLDFGIARVADNPDATAYGTVLGTPGYMAPEQACGRLDEVGPRSDVWSAGALLYTLLSGKVLHDAPNPIASVVRAQNEAVPPARTLVPGLAEGVAHVLDGALAFEVSERWMDASAMRWAVRAATDELRGKREGGSCAGVAVDGLAPPTGARSDGHAAPARTTAPPSRAASSSTKPRRSWQPVPWIAAAAAAMAFSITGLAVRAHRADARVASATGAPVATTEHVAPYAPIAPVHEVHTTWTPAPADQAVEAPTAGTPPTPATPPTPTVDVDSLPTAAPAYSSVPSAPPSVPQKAALRGQGQGQPRGRGHGQEIVRTIDF
jgi:serine/threonine-protein kinase